MRQNVRELPRQTKGLVARRFEFDLDPALLAFVKGRVRVERRPEWFMLSQKASRIDFPAAYHVDEHGNVPAVIAVAHVNREVVIDCFADPEGTGCLRVDAADRQHPRLC
jgi:hypothetical protein